MSNKRFSYTVLVLNERDRFEQIKACKKLSDAKDYVDAKERLHPQAVFKIRRHIHDIIYTTGDKQ